MKYFLEQIADHLYDNYDNNLYKHCLVFPNRRAGLFLMKHLASKIQKPIWMPKILTINELFLQCSSLSIAPDEQLVIELYKLYREISRKEETIDKFYFWGEMLVNDFDDIDKYLVNAKDLFTNIADLHDIDDRFEGLTPEQIAVIKKFFKNFEGIDTDQKRDFSYNWSILFTLYSSFKEKLKSIGVAYEGMIDREVVGIEDVVQKNFSAFDKYHFIGFNALNTCEKKLMKMLKNTDKACFYWDYGDNLFFQEDTSAGFFLNDNIKEYGQSFCADYKNVPLPKMDVIDIPSESGQTMLLANVLNDIGNKEEHHKTAIILADENLLPAVLSSIPPDIKDINITMGYPFNMTVVYSLLKSLLAIQEGYIKPGDKVLFAYRKVLAVLSNPLVRSTVGDIALKKREEICSNNVTFIEKSFFDEDEFLKSLFAVAEDTRVLCGYLRGVFMTIAAVIEQNKVNDGENSADLLTLEFLFRANQVLNRIEPLIVDESVSVSKKIAIKLLDKVFRAIKVPFSGEPLKGLQVMGVLESRALDFDNLIMLSVNEGVLPKSSAAGSYIPFSFREVFGLPVVRHQDSIYSYYFSRLLIRAKNVTFVYNSASEELKTGEMSRFLLRLKYSGKFNLSFSSVKVNVIQQAKTSNSIKRTEDDNRILKDKYIGENKVELSPSAINTWLNCQMKFYYYHVCNIKEPEQVEEGISPSLLGNLVHAVAQQIYSSYKNNEVSKEIISALRHNTSQNKALIKQEMERVWFGGKQTVNNGYTLITGDVVLIYLDKLFDLDYQFAPFTIIELEKSFSKTITIKYGGEEVDLKVGGKIDRIDEREGVRRIIDYKTGTVETGLKSIEELFDSEGKKNNNAVFQTMLYCLIMSGQNGFEHLRPVIYGLRTGISAKADDKIVIDKIPLDDFSGVASEFSNLLKNSLETLFNPEKEFQMTKEVDKNCVYCCYKNLCRR